MPNEDEICLCCHVPLDKMVNFYARRRPRVASQFAECHGAGTGCGWCVPYIEKIFEQLGDGKHPGLEMSGEEYRRRREEYRRTRKPDLPPSPDADGPLEFDLDEVLNEIPDEMKLDE